MFYNAAVLVGLVVAGGEHIFDCIKLFGAVGISNGLFGK